MKKAFTLAEILMVIAIIGVVAALTLPNLKSNTSDKEYVAALKKSVSTLQNALNLAKDKYGSDFAAWTVNDKTDAARGERIGKRLAEYLLVDVTCGLNVDENCFSKSDIFTLNNSTKTTYDKDAKLYKFQLKDQTSLGFTGTDTIKIDLDGPKNGLNTIGQDIFILKLNVDGDITYTPAHLMTSDVVTDCISGDEFKCASWVLNFDNTDYARCTGLSKDKITCR